VQYQVEKRPDNYVSGLTYKERSMPDQEPNGTEQNSAIGKGDATNNQPRVAEKDSPTGNSATPATSDTLPTEAQEIVRQSREAAANAFKTIAASATTTTNGNSPVTASSAEITDELEKGGPAFGTLIRSVGLAVSEAQSALDKNMRETAQALSETNIKVIAIFEQVINDDGTLAQGNPIIEELPLINYLMPTPYQFSEVKVFSSMKVSEFNSANGFNIQQRASAFSAGASGGYSRGRGFSVSGSVGYSTTNSSASVDSSASQDLAAGEIQMEATLKPREVVLPTPLITQKGPRLELSTGSRLDITDPEDATKVIGSKVILTATLTKTNGGPNDLKQLSISVDQPSLTYTTSPTDGKTDANGELKITIKRMKTASDDLTTPLSAQVRVWLNLVNSAVGIRL
jgi:hypothetical protein